MIVRLPELLPSRRCWKKSRFASSRILSGGVSMRNWPPALPEKRRRGWASAALCRRIPGPVGGRRAAKGRTRSLSSLKASISPGAGILRAALRALPRAPPLVPRRQSSPLWAQISALTDTWKHQLAFGPLTPLAFVGTLSLAVRNAGMQKWADLYWGFILGRQRADKGAAQRIADRPGVCPRRTVEVFIGAGKLQVRRSEKEYTHIKVRNMGVFILATRPGCVEKKVCAVLTPGGYCKA